MMESANRDLLTAKEVPEEQTAGSMEDVLGKHHYMLVQLYLLRWALLAAVEGF